MITEGFVSLKTAKLLKEKGFEQDTDYATSWYANQYYKNSCQGEWFEGEHQIIEDIDDKYNISYLSERGIFIPAPTQSVAMKWLREVHNIFIGVNTVIGNDKNWGYEVFIQKQEVPIPSKIFWDWFNTYEQACEAAIKYCLEHLI